MIKTTGAEWKAFLHDDAYWGEWAFEEYVYIINGNVAGEDVNENSFADADIIKVDDGFAWDQANGSDKSEPLATFFRRWRKQQTTEVMAVEVPKDRADAVREAIKAAGGKVK